MSWSTATGRSPAAAVPGSVGQYIVILMKRTLVLAFLLVIPACAGRRPDSLSRLETLDQSALRIQVDNQNFGDAVIHAVDGGRRIRLGSVTGKRSETFTFRWSVERLQIQVHFTGGQTFLSEQIIVYPGVDDSLLLTIGSGNRVRLFIGRRRR